MADVQVVGDSGSRAPQSIVAEPAAVSSEPVARVTRSSVAVLPFANLTGDPDKEYLGDGLAEELIHTLARVPQLHIPSRTSSFAYKGRNVDLREIARELEVGAILEGSVRSAGERLRVTAQLIDGETGFHLWSEHFDRRIEDLFDLQDELANAIVLQTLNVTLHGLERDRVRRGPPTRDLEAYLLYLRATADQMRVGYDPRRGYELLQQALRRDPEFAQARSALIAARAVAMTIGVDLPGSLEDANREAQEALSAAPHLASTHTALGCINAFQGRWVQAEQDFQTSLQLDPTEPWAQHYYGMFLLGSVGHMRRYVAIALEAERLAPSWVVSALNVIVSLTIAGWGTEARNKLEEAMHQGWIGLVSPVPDILSTLALRAGRYAEAASVMSEALPAPMRAAGGIDAIELIHVGLADPAHRKRAVAALDHCCTNVDLGDLQTAIHRRLVVWYAALGAFDQAFEILNLSLDRDARKDTVGIAWAFLWLEELQELRADPRFLDFATRLKLPDYWNRYGPPDGCDWRAGGLIRR